MNQFSGTISRVRGSVVDNHTVRGIALTATQGLKRGAAVEDSGHLLRVPVGNATLGRALKVLGEPLDGKAPIAQRDGVEWRPVQYPPMPFSRASDRVWQPTIL